MAAPKGNQFWKLVGRAWDKEKTFSGPEELWIKAIEYFQWCDENPWYKNDPVKAGDHFGETVKTPTQRPYTISGLCLFLGISQDTLLNYEKKEGYEAYFGITRAIKEIIYTQKFEGAAVGAFKENIIARDLGLVDKREDTANPFKELSELKVTIVKPEDE